jgi:hypothetical protein
MSQSSRDRLLFWMNENFKNWTPARQSAALALLVNLVEISYEEGEVLGDCEFSHEIWNAWAQGQPDESITHVPAGCICKASRVRSRIKEK